MQKVPRLHRKAMRKSRDQIPKPNIQEDFQQRIQSSIQGRQAMLPHRDLRLGPRGVSLSLREWRKVRFLKVSDRHGQEAFQELLPAAL